MCVCVCVHVGVIVCMCVAVETRVLGLHLSGRLQQDIAERSGAAICVRQADECTALSVFKGFLQARLWAG